MKPLVKKILEAGLVDKHMARQMEQWGQLEPGSAELVGKQQVTADNLEAFAEDIAELVEQGHQVKETRLEIPVRKPPVELFCPNTGGFTAVEDEMERYIVAPHLELFLGARIWGPKMLSEDPPWIVTGIDKIHQGDNLIALQVTVEKPPLPDHGLRA